MRKRIFVLDACALIAFMKDEEGAEVVGPLIKGSFDGKIDLIVNKINLLEVFYDFYRSEGREFAMDFLEDFRNWKVIIHDFTDEIMIEAGRLKAGYKISLADSVALGQAIVSGAVFLTSDRHEFGIIDKQGIEDIEFCWIR
jgi:predicted nucleic acid-binding protein